ncbi:MAG: alpha-amylase family glycosyl hydrolase [Acidimicrobiia bacterium]
MHEWWRDAVLYQIYVRSFADSNGDGIGDLQGVVARLDHLAWLGVDGIWLSPTFPSPNGDWGYDVADYFGVHPDLGTQDDLDALIAAADTAGIKILLDLVPNHTSIEHEWFRDARSSRTSAHRDWYVWADPAPDGGPPNNWVSSFAGPAWTLDPSPAPGEPAQYYLHNFLDSQADLNWWNPDVRDEFDRILRHWFDRGVAGFRIDVAHMIVKDADLRDNPPAGDDDFLLDRLRGQVPVYNSNRPEVHDVHRHWRGVADGYDPPRLLLGETFVGGLEEVIPYYGSGDELGLAFNIPFLQAPFEAATLCALVEETERLLPGDCTPVWTGSNHDVSRGPTRWAAGNVDAFRCALVMLLTLRGSAVLYYGDEIGLPDTDVPDDRLLDPVTIRLRPILDRDAARTPMPWSAGPGAGFTGAGTQPWLPFGDVDACNVADQRDDPDSTLQLTRALLALRKEHVDLRTGGYRTVVCDGSLWVWQRGDAVLVAVNLGPGASATHDVEGTILVGTDPARVGAGVRGRMELGPYEGVVISRAV